MIRSWVSEEARLSLEVVLLLVAGMALLIAGALLFPIYAGKLSYYENGLYGLLLFIFALQTTTLGKTPFGEMRRSAPLIGAGLIVAVVGIFTCFIPDTMTFVPRLMLFLFLAPGGLILLAQMCLSPDKLRAWMRMEGALFRHLIAACAAVYLMSTLCGLLVLHKGLLSARATAVAVLAFGACIIYLAIVLELLYRKYPEVERASRLNGPLSTDKVLTLFMGMTLLLLGWLLIPVSLGMLPFSGSAQVGLLAVLISFTMLASGDTPVGTFTRSWPLIALGMALTALGIVSCIIPYILILPLMILIGLTNIASGALGLWRLFAPGPKGSEEPRSETPRIMKRLFAAMLTFYIATMIFGLSAFAGTLIPSLVLGVILSINGCILLYLVHANIVLERMQNEAMGANARA